MYRIINLIPFERKKNYMLGSISDVTFIIKTLERKTQLINQLYSIQKLNFNGPILIADDSRKPYGGEILALFPKLNITYFPMEYDSGTSVGRNLMLDHCTTPYFILCDDDFLFEPRTRIPLMREMLIENELDLLGGVFLEYWGTTSWENRRNKIAKKLLSLNILLPPTHKYEYTGNFHISENNCTVTKVEYQDPFVLCDLTHNFFIAKTRQIKKLNGWNPLLKGGEHHNFFLRAKFQGLKIASTRKFGIIHDRSLTPSSDEYKQLRQRDGDFQKIAFKEFGIKRFEHYNGSIYENY